MLTVTKVEKCPHCGGTDIVKNGFTPHGNQRIYCKACEKSPVLHRKKVGLSQKELSRAFLERLSLRGISRVFAVSYYYVFKQLNLKCVLLADFKTQIKACKSGEEMLEFDELCSFCGCKKNKQWLWAALCRRTRQIVGYVIGDRSEATFRRLLRKIPVEYLKGASFSDHWKSYRMLLSKGNHTQVGKESGQTNHIERWNATLRARITRYVRKSLSFSRNLKYHHLVTKLFIVHYNRDCGNMNLVP
ncbi:MAG TPA: IS1 family transposase [Cyanobacteria bacterium UBA11049]|nr:IS1 family transposase [Cyanobacteria bacterium UBA11049]